METQTNSIARRNTCICFDCQISARTVAFSTFISLNRIPQKDLSVLPQFPCRGIHEENQTDCMLIRPNDFRRLSYQPVHIEKPSGTEHSTAQGDCATNWTGAGTLRGECEG